jgi:hypothetical protein
MSNQPTETIAEDRGEGTINVGNADGRVVVTFPSPMQWLGMSPKQAIALAVALVENARFIDPDATDEAHGEERPTVQ